MGSWTHPRYNVTFREDIPAGQEADLTFSGRVTGQW